MKKNYINPTFESFKMLSAFGAMTVATSTGGDGFDGVGEGKGEGVPGAPERTFRPGEL